MHLIECEFRCGPEKLPLVFIATTSGLSNDRIEALTQTLDGELVNLNVRAGFEANN